MTTSAFDEFKARHADKFAPADRIFSHIRRGDRIFVGTGCGEPQYLVRALTEYVRSNPKAFFDAEILHVWSLGVAPYTDERLQANFRHNSFFVGDTTRAAVNRGLADYTPIFLSQVPDLFHRRHIDIDVALIQTSLPDRHGYLSLGVSVDIVKAAVESAVARRRAGQPPHAARATATASSTSTRSTTSSHHDEPLLEYQPSVPDEIAARIGKYVARIVQDGDTIQVGYGSVPNAIMAALGRKKHLGLHTELLTDGIVDLMRRGVIDNSRKTINRGKTVASFCMGSAGDLRVHRRQPDDRVPHDRLHEQPAGHRAAREHDRDQRGARDRPHRPGDAPSPSAAPSTAASAARPTSCAAPCSRPAARRSWRCRPRATTARRRASCRSCRRAPA